MGGATALHAAAACTKSEAAAATCVELLLKVRVGVCVCACARWRWAPGAGRRRACWLRPWQPGLLLAAGSCEGRAKQWAKPLQPWPPDHRPRTSSIPPPCRRARAPTWWTTSSGCRWCAPRRLGTSESWSCCCPPRRGWRVWRSGPWRAWLRTQSSSWPRRARVGACSAGWLAAGRQVARLAGRPAALPADGPALGMQRLLLLMH
jgi:hypothetical protein